MKPILFLLSLTLSLLANDVSTRYDVNVGLFGKVGHADLEVHTEKERYTAFLRATTTGTAATLTSGRIETYASEGKIIDGAYVPSKFTRTKQTNDAKRVQTYVFDHEKQTVTLTQVEDKKVHESYFDHKSFKMKKRERNEHSEQTKVLPEYAQYDVLSSYLNASKHCNAANKQYDLQAIGAHNDEKEVTLAYLDSQDKAGLTTPFSHQDDALYRLSVKALDTAEEPVSILIAFDNDGHIKEALLGDSFWVGEIKAQRVYHNVSLND